MGNNLNHPTKVEADNLSQISVYALKRQGELAYFPKVKQFKYGGNYFMIDLSYQKCFFGSQRAWLKCPTCGRQVGILYVLNNLIGCRLCFNLCYHSQNLSSHLKKDFIFRALDNLVKANDLEKKIKRPIYAGEITKKQRKFEQFYYKFIKAAMMF